MSRELIENSEKYAGLILYNHLYIRENPEFTLQELENELQEKKIVIEHNIIQKKLDDFIQDGLVSRGVKSYMRSVMG